MSSSKASASPAALSSLLSGSLFGSALLLSGVYSPAIITSQLSLSNFHMLEAFLSASAVSALVVLVADETGWARYQIRDPRKLTFSSIPYSGNLLGGSLLGLGMGLTGACPGTVLVQIATGVSSGLWVAAGGLLAGIIWSVVRPHVLASAGPTAPSTTSASKKVTSSKEVDVKAVRDSSSKTLQGTLHLSTSTILLLYEAMCLAMILASLNLAPKTSSASFLPPALGGVFIGLAQAATLLMTRKTVGVSGAYGDIGAWITSLFGGSKASSGLLSPSVLFAAGILAGSAGLASWRPEVLLRGGEMASPEPARAFVGGIASILGASIAGGCTSGHGISGMATFSTASFLTVAAMFGGGIATMKLLV